MQLLFTVPAQPMSWKRASSRGGARFTPKEMRNRQATMVLLALQAAAEQGWAPGPDDRFRVSIVNVYARPDKRPKHVPKHTWEWGGRCYAASASDWDNLGKMVCDALEQAGVVSNDNRIVHGASIKVYAAKDEPPCTEVRLVRLATMGAEYRLTSPYFETCGGDIPF